jgi:hypothetical protein
MAAGCGDVSWATTAPDADIRTQKDKTASFTDAPDRFAGSLE